MGFVCLAGRLVFVMEPQEHSSAVFSRHDQMVLFWALPSKENITSGQANGW